MVRLRADNKQKGQDIAVLIPFLGYIRRNIGLFLQNKITWESLMNTSSKIVGNIGLNRQGVNSDLYNKKNSYMAKSNL
ncbi:hypothetical protein RIR_jg41031.t1 [Rhizophagus irregularis DAOM 181602=DAOM 197198]|nr:hypothetical protein RIR_jg41031.t1 [Rhizophagus irregularis DAOM 181602=DAOM 197198]